MIAVVGEFVADIVRLIMNAYFDFDNGYDQFSVVHFVEGIMFIVVFLGFIFFFLFYLVFRF